MPYHLPVLLNPLINAVFNCPNPASSNLKKLFNKLTGKDFILLVPSNDKLLNYEDLESGSLVHDLCYTFDFVASHILMIDHCSVSDTKRAINIQQVEYLTLNGKKIILRPQNRILLTSDGFADKKRHRIQSVDLLTNFNDYLEGAERVPLIYIDEPLCGNLVRHENLTFVEDLKSHEKVKMLPREMPLTGHSAFKNIIRVHPDWIDKFNSLFSCYRSKNIDSGPCEDTFHEIIEDSYNSMHSEILFASIPSLRDLIYKYVETNLYDDIWLRLTAYHKSSERDTEGLENLSLDQLESDLYTQKFDDFHLSNVINMEKNIYQASESFSRLSVSHTYAEKSEALIETLQNLSKSESDKLRDQHIPMAMDADSLLSFFVLVVCRTQVKNLKSHFYYLQRFAPDESSVKFGILGYALSTFEAAICYFDELKKTERLQKLKSCCASSRDLVEVLSNGTDKIPKDPKAFEAIFQYRSKRGESLLSLCVIGGKNDLLIDLLKYETVYPLEDLLEDENIDGCTLLVQALMHENSSAASIITNILLSSCSTTEIRQYINRPDLNNRTASHYLGHETDILNRIGRFIDWRYRDINGQTPLFTIFRSYDQPDYEEVVVSSFRCAVEWYNSRGLEFCFFDHVDNKGNTLLHILKRNAKLLVQNENIDVNAVNKKGLTPLMTYAKYNRLENVKAILNDNRIIVEKEQCPIYLTCFDYAKNPLVLHELAKRSAQDSALGLAFVHTLRFEDNKWMLHITMKSKDSDSYKTARVQIRLLQSLFRTVLKKYPMSFVPLEEPFEKLSNLGKMKLTLVGRVEMLYLKNFLTDCFSTLVFIKELDHTLIFDESQLTLWIRSENKKISGIPKFQNDLKKMEPEEMNVIQNFLRFNQAELGSVKSKLQVLKKLAMFSKLKAGDVVNAHKILSMYSKEYFEAIACQVHPEFPVFSSNGESSIVVLIQEIGFLYRCTSKLHGHVQMLLQNTIPRWWKLYAELLELHKEYAQNFPHLLKSDLSSSEDGIFGKLLEGKRAKYEQRLSSNIADCRRSLDEAGNVIRHSHELLAEELSKYMDFRGTFFVNGIIKKWVRENIKVLKEHLLEMRKIKLQESKYTRSGEVSKS